MSAARASLLAALMAALMVAVRGEGTHAMFTQYEDANCTVQAQVFVASYDVVLPGDNPLARALRSGCAPVNFTNGQTGYASVSDCMVRYYATPGCGAGGDDPIDEMHMHSVINLPPCMSNREGGSTMIQCVTSVPPGVVDASACLSEMPDTSSISQACEECFGQPPSTCGEALGVAQGCASQCTDAELHGFMASITLIFGCACTEGGDGGNGEPPTCGEIKEAYKENQCCGNPARPFEMPVHRRLASGPVPKAPAAARKAAMGPKAKLSRWPLPAMRRLSPAIAARANDATAAAARRLGSMDPGEHALRAMQKVLEGVKRRHGTAAAKTLAAKAKALMDSY